MKKLNHRHVLAAQMMAVGASRGQIAETLGYYPTSVSRLKRSPVFRDLVSKLQRQILESTMAALRRRIVE